MKVLGRIGWPPFECKGQAGFDYHGHEVVEVERDSTPVIPVEWFKPHCEDCRILGEHYRANETCWCDHCAIGAMHQADLRKERELNP